MDRKEFLKTTLAALGTTTVLPVLNNSAFAEAAPTDHERKFREFWVTTMMSSMDSTLTPDERRKVMESNGRACARRGLGPTLEKQKDAGAGVATAMLASFLGEKNVARKGNEITVVYEKCACPLVQNGPECLSGTWCHCSSGWLKQIYENATGKPVGVEIKQAIKRGDPVCRLVVQL